jgi:transposase
MTGSRGRVCVSQETLNRDEVIRDFFAGRLSRREAAGALGKSERQVSRMIQRWKKKGVLGLEHGLLGRKSKKQLDEEFCHRVIALLKGKYSGFNLKHFHERLLEVEKVPSISYSSVKRLAHRQGIARVKKRRGVKIRKRRTRFSQAGYMLQMDGSKHVWWKGQECCLIAGIDDATSDVPWGEFFPTESLEGYIRVLRRVIELRGVPRVLYVDRASWLGGLSDEETSQFERMCAELGTRVIHAHSAEAKGRVERLWGTLQDRLVSELRLHDIASLEKATSYLNGTFLPETWSPKFTVQAESPSLLYRPRPEGKDLEQIFCLKLERKIRKDHTVLFGNEVYAITAQLTHSLARRQAEIRIYSDGQIRGFWGDLDLELRQARKRSWAKGEKPKFQPGLSTWQRVLGEDFLLHSGNAHKGHSY